MYSEFYKDAVFTHLVQEELHLKQVVNTNKCLVRLQKFNNKLLVTSVIDNLLKGASGQAVQNMNLRFGLGKSWATVKGKLFLELNSKYKLKNGII